MIEFDSVYFLMFGGWKNELYANRWHFATRWARKLPVVLVQPTQTTPIWKLTEEPEPRIPNCSILYIKASISQSSYFSDLLVQVGQVQGHMFQHGHARPLLWCYNPSLFGLFAGLPAVFRLYHATENFFHFEGRPDSFYEQVKATIRISDLTVAVSDGVASSIFENQPEALVSVVSNGCDYQGYSTEKSRDEELCRLGDGRSKVAIFAGGINSRIDFDLLEILAKRNPTALFVFAGPVHDLSSSQQKQWQALVASENVRYMGVVDSKRLPSIYRASDIGIIPYRSDRLLIENGFPLKTLEMCATGLPVVSTLLRPIVGLAHAVKVTDSTEEFLAAFAASSRKSMPQHEREELEQVCRGNDYDIKFDHILQLIGKTMPQNAPLQTKVDTFLGDLLVAQWSAFAAREGRGFSLPSVRIKPTFAIEWIQPKQVAFHFLLRSYHLLPKFLRRVASAQVRAKVANYLQR